MLSIIGYLRSRGMRDSFWCYNGGTALLLLYGKIGDSWEQITSAILFFGASLVYRFLENYWLGCFLRFVGLAFLFSSLEWNLGMRTAAVLSMGALALGSLEPLMKKSRRFMVFVLLTVSRAPFILGTWGDWLLVSVMAVWIAGDACVAINIRPQKSD